MKNSKSKSKTKKVLFATVGTNMLMLSLSAYILMLGNASDRTIVDLHRSYSTQQCVNIVDYSDNDRKLLNCDVIPEKYNLVWVK